MVRTNLIWISRKFLPILVKVQGQYRSIVDPPKKYFHSPREARKNEMERIIKNWIIRLLIKVD